MYPGQGGDRDRTRDPSDRPRDISAGYHQGLDDWAAYDQGAGGPGSGTVAVVVGAAVVILALIGVLAYLVLGRSGGDGDSAGGGAVTVTSTAPATVTDAPLPQTPSRAAAPAAVLEECSDSGDDVLPRSGRGTTVTSCPFAEEVRDTYLGAGHRGGAAEIEASSPVTGVTYSMECAADRDAVVCRGGDNAVVYLY